ncbi:MAG: 3-oxoacyl-ACP reductase FabG [Christensenellaceae bacterium]|jgi:3-oxoacyl-[acyl-carrier protein] reductase|nr:3-oxoacyl-ACP reductase FabG [Christensenellaceae bacterium]
MENKTILITGASGDIGAAIAEAFAEPGNELYLNYFKSENDAMLLKDRLISKTHVDIYKADIRNVDQIDKMVEYLLQRSGKIDIIINNAGVSLLGLLTDHTCEEIQHILDTNLTGLINLTQKVVKPMVSAKKGKIINISSIWGLVGASCEAVYSASKAGIIGFTKALAKELGPSGITVNCVAPGFIKTRMNSEIDENARSTIIENTPLRREGVPKDIANMVYFLASDKSSFITGQTIAVDGGFAV